MFGSLAALLVMIWHKGAMIRMFLRGVAREGTRTGASLAVRQREREAHEPPRRVASSSSPRQRVEVDDPEKVRVHTMELGPEEVVGNTDVDAIEADGKRRARR
jgi:hypothetical protein